MVSEIERMAVLLTGSIEQQTGDATAAHAIIVRCSITGVSAIILQVSAKPDAAAPADRSEV
jgi:hypothetical protein